MDVASTFVLSNYLYQIPVFIVWVAGLIIALMRWQRHPRPSLLLTSALAIFLVRALIGPVVTFAIVHSASSMLRIGLVQGLFGLFSSLIAAGAWALLLAAALGWRDKA